MRSVLALALATACYHAAPDVACTSTCEDGLCPASLECGMDKLCHVAGGPECSAVRDASSETPDAPGSGCIQQIAVYRFQSCALRSDHTGWCWGFNGHGSIGDGTSGTNRGEPTQVMNLTDATSLTVGDYATYAIRANGDVVAWGSN